LQTEVSSCTGLRSSGRIIGELKPWSKSFTFADPYPYQAALRISDVEIFPTVKGEFRAELMQINLNQLWMQRGRENLPHVVAGTVRPVRKAISFLTKERGRVYCGQEASLGSIIVRKTDFQHRRNGADRNWGSMSLTHSDFDAACKAMTGANFRKRRSRSLFDQNMILCRDC